MRGGSASAGCWSRGECIALCDLEGVSIVGWYSEGEAKLTCKEGNVEVAVTLDEVI